MVHVRDVRVVHLGAPRPLSENGCRIACDQLLDESDNLNLRHTDLHRPSPNGACHEGPISGSIVVATAPAVPRTRPTHKRDANAFGGNLCRRAVHLCCGAGLRGRQRTKVLPHDAVLQVGVLSGKYLVEGRLYDADGSPPDSSHDVRSNES